ncbi:MAG: cysteine desulfurase [Clostridiales bacterium]|nr:cysteine desulfurase [Clostridiales bacterium]
MITNQAALSGLPSEEEIARLALSYFPEFDEERCADGIERLVTENDTQVIQDAAKKAEQWYSQGIHAASFDNSNYVVKDTENEVSAGGVSSEVSEIEKAGNYGGVLVSGEFGSLTEYDYYHILDEYIRKDEPLTKPDTDTKGYPEGLKDTERYLAHGTSNQGGYAPQILSKEAADSGLNGGTGAYEGYRTVLDKTEQNNSGIIVGSKTLEQIRNDFPILSEKVNGHNLIWLDNGATTQRPKAVIDRLSYYYEHENSNVHRGAHALAARSTDAYEAARQTVADFIGAGNKDNIVFVRGTTEGINLVAQAYVKQYLNPGDEIIVTQLEHHANIVPWQLVAQETGAVIKVAPVDASGQIILSEYEKLFSKRTKFVSATHVSNVLGTITPVAELIAIAHQHGVRILIDGAQSVAHIPVNVTALDADFFVFSGHKIFGPTGIGALYGKKEVLEAARPYHGGGNMIADVTFERTIYNPAPNKFEAGTGSIADAVGLGAALDYLTGIGIADVNRHEHELLQYATKEMQKIKGLHLIGTATNKASVLSFKLDGVADEAVGKRLDEHGIAVRVGHHCAQPILRSYGLESVVRPTLALYNSFEDIDALVKAIRTLV